MRELLVKTQEVEDQEGEKRCFEYSLLIDEMETPGGFSCESYGVKVAQRGGGAAVCPHVTTSAARVDELLELLERGQVGPTGLRDVVEDWL